jgi:ubiquinone/menaquinone biosynthesis C-methylase UbiE
VSGSPSRPRGLIAGDLSSFTTYYGGASFNQGAPKPDGTGSVPTGTIDPTTGAFTLEWTSRSSADHSTGSPASGTSRHVHRQSLTSRPAVRFESDCYRAAVPDGFQPARIRTAYDTVAARYHAAFGDEIAALELDRELIDRLADIAADGLVLEAGAGVAPVARRLRDSNVIACDLSSRMLSFAPDAAGRVQADICQLPFPASTFAVAVARYVLQHIRRNELPRVLAELRRVMIDGGHLLVAVHLGQGQVELDELLHQQFEPINGAFHQRDEIHLLLDAAGFAIIDEHQRGPVAGEADTQRLYVTARAVS